MVKMAENEQKFLAESQSEFMKLTSSPVSRLNIEESTFAEAVEKNFKFQRVTIFNDSEWVLERPSP